MNVLLVLHWMRADGSGIYFARLANELDRRGHKVIVLSAGGPLVEELRKNGIKHHRLRALDQRIYPVYYPYVLVSPMSLLQVLRNVAKKVGNRFPTVAVWLKRFVFYLILPFSLLKMLIIIKTDDIQLIHAHSGEAVVLSYLSHKLLHIPFFVFSGSPVATDLAPELFRRIYPTVSQVIVVSKECLDFFSANGYGQDKVTILPPGVDVNRFRPMTPSERLSLKESLQEEGIALSGRKVVLLVSRLDPDKEDSIISTIEAMPLIVRAGQDVFLLIVGGGILQGEAARRALEINEQFGEDRIALLGYRDDVYKLMNVADIVIAVGQTATEALACGKPTIIAGHRKGIHGGSFGGIVTEHNADILKDYNFTGRNSSEATTPLRIAKACISLLKNEDRMREIGEFSRRFAVENLDINKSMSLIIKFYLDALGESI